MSNVPSSITGLLGLQKRDLDLEQKIVEKLLDEENLDTKTELQNPIRWSALNTIKTFITDLGLTESAEILDDFMFTTFKYLISKDRKGRLEYIQALQNIKKEEQITTKESLSSMKVDKK